MQGPCPNCGESNITYFGDIFTVPGPRETTTVKCPNCKTQLMFSNERRQVWLSEHINACQVAQLPASVAFMYQES